MERFTNPANGRVHGEYTWCSACQRAERTEEWDRGIWVCPHCQGIARDGRPWEDVRNVCPTYPLTPTRQETYSWPTDSETPEPA